MKYLISFFTILLLLSCDDTKLYSSKFEEFIDRSDTLSKLNNSTYNLLVDSLTISLRNYDKRIGGIDSLGIVKSAYFSMTTSIVSSHIYYVTITLFKNNKLAFENYSNSLASFINDPVSLNRLKDFKDIISVKHDNWKFIYIENITIELHEPFLNDVNLYLKKLLIDKDYKEIEFYREGAFWTKNNNWH